MSSEKTTEFMNDCRRLAGMAADDGCSASDISSTFIFLGLMSYALGGSKREYVAGALAKAYDICLAEAANEVLSMHTGEAAKA